jgi:hypothetical protein
MITARSRKILTRPDLRLRIALAQITDKKPFLQLAPFTDYAKA